jgi:adenosylcobinamide-GDP ribazoletransferase
VSAATESQLCGLACACLLSRHAVHRLGGITGDVLGALAEVAATVTLLVAAITRWSVPRYTRSA